jgi:hypothetical protein
MSAFSDYMEDKVLNWSLRGTSAGTAPANVYISLHTTATTDAGGGTEVTGSAYARKAVSTTGGFNAPSGGSTANTAEIAFTAASGGNWGTVTHFGIWDASTSGNLLYHGPLTASKTVNDGDVFRFAAGALVVTVA